MQTKRVVGGVVMATVMAACSAADEGEEVGRSSERVSCGAGVDVYPVRGPHNNGWDAEATVASCGASRSNSDFYTVAGDANHPNGHHGNDIFGPRGTPIVAARSGTIVDVSYSSIGGNNLTIRDDCGWSHYYAHLDSIASGTTVGRRLSAGTVVGALGDTGQAQGTNPHLHYSLFPGSYYDGIDPHPYLRRVEDRACEAQGGSDLSAAPRVTCGNVAKEAGFGEFALCEQNGDDACRGTGRRTDDCERCCDARDLPPETTTVRCGDLARSRGFVYALCEHNGNGACRGSGAKTSDCDHCCDSVDGPPAETTATCGKLAAQLNWQNPACEHGGNGACNGGGTRTSDCDRCCAR